MDTLAELWKLHGKDGILAVLVLWLLITDRLDRKDDRLFWANFYEKNKEKK